MNKKNIVSGKIVGAGLSAALLALGLILLFAQEPAKAQAGGNDLQFFKNYFVTGSYAVGGVGLRGMGVGGIATGTINITDVPSDGDVVAAFLYWQAVTKDDGTAGKLGVTFDGIPLSSLEGPFAKQLGVGTPPCWSTGGGTGSGGVHKTYTYRADVLRAFAWDTTTGKLVVNGAHQVQLPDGGAVTALGASLVVVYNDYNNPLQKLNAIVLYDGSHTMGQSTEDMSLNIKWFYDAKTSGKITHIVGSGQANKSEILRFNGIEIARNPFTSAEGPNWDNPTFNLSPTLFQDPVTHAVPDPLAQVTTSVDHQGFNSFDCLTWAAVIYETPVYDTDEDGLLDVWEFPRGPGAYPATDPYGQTLPNLQAMGADRFCKDAFIEIGYMKTDVETTYGTALKPAHTHLPPHEAVRLWGDAFWNAPVANPAECTRGGGIKLHVDAGTVDLPGRFTDPSKNADDYLIRAPGLARGGEFIDEIATTFSPSPPDPTADPLPPQALCIRSATDPPEACQFSGYPGTVGWKTGFRFFRDELLSATLEPLPDPPTGVDPCDLPYDSSTGEPNTGPGGKCERRFDRVRMNMFRYALFAHAIGLPKSEYPCLVSGVPAGVDTTTPSKTCAPAGVDNPDFHIPRTISGAGDLPGADFLVTLGAFSDHQGTEVGPSGSRVWTPFPTGTPFMIASTAAHEFGHNGGLGHGGSLSDPNCKPNYVSVMNYLYQLRGLLGDGGTKYLNLSGGTVGPVNEQGLVDLSFPGTSALLPYRIGWYAPLAGSYLFGHGTAVTSHCDGTRLEGGELPMVRIDARTVGSAIDWNANGTVEGTSPAYSQDLNFNARTTALPPPSVSGPEILKDFNDWAGLHLNQIGSRRSAGGLYRLFPAPTGCTDSPCLGLGPISLNASYNDYPASDYAQYDYGRAGFGRAGFGRAGFGSDLSRGDLGLGDYGRAGFGRAGFGRAGFGRAGFGRAGFGQSAAAGDQGRSYLGGGDLLLGDPNNPGGELDFETAVLLAKTPPYEFSACVVGADSGCRPDGSALHSVFSTFAATGEGGVQEYTVIRVDGATLDPGEFWTTVRTVPSEHGRLNYLVNDTAQLMNGAQYTYFAVATYNDGVQSDPSNLVTITAVNEPPRAGTTIYSTYEDATVTVAAPGVLANVTDPDSVVLPSLTAVLVTGPSHALTFALNPDGSFIYTPVANYDGTDSFAYKAQYDGGVTNTATVTITITPVNDAPVASGQTIVTDEDTAKAITVSVTDVDSGSLTYNVISGPGHGTLSGTPPAVTYTPAADYNGFDSFTFKANDGSLDSNVATVSITVYPVNDPPTISDITDQAIDWNTSTGALAFTINDPDGLIGATVSGSSSNTTLVPVASILFGGSGTARTVTVTPAPNQSGTATITVLVTDSGGSMASDAFQLTVKQVAYTLFGLQNVPPAVITKSKAGSTVPMKWQFRNGSLVVNSSGVHHTVTVQGGSLNKDFSDTDPGSSSFRYDATTKTWYFNLQTKDPITGVAYPVGTYTVTIKPTTPGYLPSGPFPLTLTK